MRAMTARFTGAIMLLIFLASMPAVAGAGIQIGPVTNPANGHHYYLLTPNSWTGAEAEAIALGGHLVTINDIIENGWVWATFAGYGPLWIGLHDAAGDNTFVWASGEPVTVTNWWCRSANDCEPTNTGPGGNEDFVEMNNEVWNDNADGNSFYAVVEIAAITIFNANFDADTPGALPNLNPPGDPSGDSITLLNENTPFAHIGVQGPAPAGTPGFATNSLRFDKQASTGNSPILQAIPDPAFGPYTTGVYTVEWWSASMQANGQYGFAALTVPGVASAFTVNYVGDGTIVVQDNTGVAPTGFSYAVNTPQYFRAVVDLDQRVFDLYIDNTLVASQKGFQDQAFDRIGALHWEIGGIDTESYAIDSISIVRTDVFQDEDGDGVPDSGDNCPSDYNPGQEDGDADGVGDLCDNCPVNPNPLQNFDACSANASGVNDQLSPVLVQACFQFTDVDKEYVFRPTCANTVWELSGGQGSLESTGCVNGPAAGIPDDLVPVRDGIGNPITYCTEPCNLLDRFLPDVLTPSPGVPANYQATATFTTLIQCPPGESIPGPGSDDVCPEILMVSVKSEPIEVEIPPEMNRRIDVYPGTYPNLINLGSKGNTPVAIIGSPFFDVTKVDLASIRMAGAPVATYTDKKKQKVYLASIKDFNGDGYLDLVVQFVTRSLEIQPGATTVTLTGTMDGAAFEGEDSIRTVP